jgi:hypothetical protein
LLAQLPPDLVADFLQIRKAKKAPLTQTAVDGIQREADKAGISLGDAIRACCEFGWQGFNAGWYAERTTKKHASGETAYQRSMREKMEVMAPAIAAKAPGQIRTNPNNFFDALTNFKPLEITQ